MRGFALPQMIDATATVSTVVFNEANAAGAADNLLGAQQGKRQKQTRSRLRFAHKTESDGRKRKGADIVIKLIAVTRVRLLSRFPYLKIALVALGFGPRTTIPALTYFRIGSTNYYTFASAGQDIFVQHCSQSFQEAERTFLEIGCAHPFEGNNTAILERHGWRGVSIDLDQRLCEVFRSHRKSTVMCADALDIDYSALLNENFPGAVGYLQIDIDPSHQSLACLSLIPFDDFTFGCITFEHDAYRCGPEVRDESRRILQSHGYHLAVQDVRLPGGGSFEDWWIHPSLVPTGYLQAFPKRGGLRRRDTVRTFRFAHRQNRLGGHKDGSAGLDQRE